MSPTSKRYETAACHACFSLRRHGGCRASSTSARRHLPRRAFNIASYALRPISSRAMRLGVGEFVILRRAHLISSRRCRRASSFAASRAAAASRVAPAEPVARGRCSSSLRCDSFEVTIPGRRSRRGGGVSESPCCVIAAVRATAYRRCRCAAVAPVERPQHFKAATMGKPLVMGRRTFQSIAARCRATTIVSSRQRFQSGGRFGPGDLDEAAGARRAAARAVASRKSSSLAAATSNQRRSPRDAPAHHEVDLHRKGRAFPADRRRTMARSQPPQRRTRPRDDADFAFVEYERR